MTSGTRGIGKSVHSPDQAAFCALMVGARKAAGLTQQALAFQYLDIAPAALPHKGEQLAKEQVA